MTNQQAFDQAVTWCLAQGRKSEASRDVRLFSGAVAQRPMCLYRGPDGLRCAVGTLIPDAEYQEMFDTDGAVLAEVQACVPSLAGVSTRLLSDLQNIHDQLSLSSWRDGFRLVAMDFGLTWPLDSDVVPVNIEVVSEVGAIA